MSELKATRGPWELVEVPRGFIVTADERSYDIAIVWNLGYHDNKANAALIAAAPELYAALAWYTQNDDVNLGEAGNEFYTAGYEAAVVAIKKARGEA